MVGAVAGAGVGVAEVVTAEAMVVVAAEAAVAGIEGLGRLGSTYVRQPPSPSPSTLPRSDSIR